jgi:hypothetical protein
MHMPMRRLQTELLLSIGVSVCSGQACQATASVNLYIEQISNVSRVTPASPMQKQSSQRLWWHFVPCIHAVHRASPAHKQR